MIEHHQSTDGNPIVTGVRSWQDAQAILEGMGKEKCGVSSVGVLNVYVKDWYTGMPKSKGYVHVHFFGGDGRELAYFTPSIGYLHVFQTPRTWHPDFKARLEAP